MEGPLRRPSPWLTIHLFSPQDETPVVTFPDDYPNSVRHFLLIGFLAMFIGAGVFFYMGATRKVNTTMHTVIFFVCAITAWYAAARAF